MEYPFDKDDLNALRWRLDTYGNLPTNLVHDLIDALEKSQDELAFNKGLVDRYSSSQEKYMQGSFNTLNWLAKSMESDK